MSTVMTSFRVSQDLLDRTDALIPTMAALPEYQVHGDLKRSAILRIALMRGLDELEREHATASKKQK